MAIIKLTFEFFVVCLCSCFHAIYVNTSSVNPERVKSGLPDFSQDSYMEDQVDSMADRDLIKVMRHDNEEVPDRCRTDLCWEKTTPNNRQGDITWPPTTLGMRSYRRCPYAIQTAIYAHMDCVLNEDNVTVWDYIPNAEKCPEQPLAELVKRVRAEMEAFESTNTSVDWIWYIDVIHKIDDVMVTYPDVPIIYSYPTYIMVDFLGRLNDENADTGALTNNDIKAVLTIFDTFQERGHKSYEAGTTFMSILPVLVHGLTIPGGQHRVILVTSLCVMSVIRLKATGRVTNTTLAFEQSQGGAYSVVAAMDVHMLTEETDVMRLFTARVNTELLKFSPRLEATSKIYPNIDSHDYIAGLWSDNEADHSGGGADEDESPGTIYRRPAPLGLLEPDTFAYYCSAAGKQFGANTIESSVRLFVSLSLPWNETRIVLDSACGSFEVDRGDTRSWTTDSCGEPSFQEPGRIQCNCLVDGFLAAFAYSLVDQPRVTSPSVIESSGKTLVEFMGFPFIWELYVTSHVLRAISLVCLLLTVISYIIYRKARRGVPTRILLNLCVTLILLLVTLYVTERIAGSHLGCRVSNVMRYYLVMTSLMWNGVEAVNMYLMLVKVFNSRVAHFTKIAALISYVSPAIMMGIVFAFDTRGFDGIYDVECEFRCQMKPYTMYFAYLLPMGVIITHNMVIFVLVMRVLVKHGQREVNGDKKKSHWVRLAGAVSTMVLLGVPWIFSAFGAIDAAASNKALAVTEGIFQVVFVVFVNMQGQFLFLFHCARNSAMRESVRSTFTSSTKLYQVARSQKNMPAADPI